MDKRKRFKHNLEIFRDIFKICPRVQGQDFDALPTDEEIMSFLREFGHTREINSLNDVVFDHMHQPWRTFVLALTKFYLERLLVLTRFVSPEHKSFETLSWRNKIRMYTSRDDYLINTLRFVSAKEETQIYGAILPKSLTSPKMKETKAYKTYLGFSIGTTPPKKVQKFKKPTSHKLTYVPVLTEEPTGKSKRVKRLAKKSTKAPAREVRRKSMRDFHKTHPSGFGTATKTAPGAVKIKSLVTNEGTDVKPRVPDSGHEENKEDEDDEEEVKDEFVKTPSNDFDDEDETNITNKAEGDEDEEMDYTTKILQVIEDAHVTLSTVLQKTEVLVTSSSHSSDLAVKFLNFLDIPHTDAEIVSPMDVYVHHEVPIQQTPTLLIVHVSVISDSSPVFSTVIPQSLPSFTPSPHQSTSTPPPTTKATNPPFTLPDFASVFQFNNRVTCYPNT
uniref:Uncharacterized protein n=1 Tax=Tanacetum cinerariifolium TaxID=118510 RepID=A0A699GIR7_TANCI|nr:hypothetical protein [Tanacetum cinerariifolium]